MTCAIDYGSICSGIEAASMAWECLGFTPRWFAEIEPFPSAVLAHRWPDVPNLGDMTKLAREVLLGNIVAPLILVGGTPCQDFSVAGMRQGLAGERGALTIKFVELADAIDHVRPTGDECVVVWENVPGVLSDRGNAFGCFLGALVGESDALQPSGGKWTNAGCVYGPRRTAAWRVLDAQYFGLAQRRRRVFVVASARDGFDPAAVLFESGGVRRDSAPSRGAAEETARSAACGSTGDGGDPGRQEAGRASTQAFGGGKNCNPTDVSTAVTAHPGGRYDLDAETFVVAPTLAGGGRRAGGYSLDDVPMTAATLRGQPNCSHRPDADTFLVAGTLNANTKAAGSATQQDAHAGLLVVHGTQDPSVQRGLAHALGRNNGQENAILASSCNLDEDGLTCRDRRMIAFANGHDIEPSCSACNTAHAIQAGALRINPASGPDGVGVQAEHAYTLEARAEVQAVCITGSITHTLKAEGFDASEDGTGRGQPIVFDPTQITSPTFRSNPLPGDPCHTLASGARLPTLVASQVRRLTPRECERLQGFPDDYTLIPWRGRPAEECPDGPRYKAIGNSKAVPVVRWIGRRLLAQLK